MREARRTLGLLLVLALGAVHTEAADDPSLDVVPMVTKPGWSVRTRSERAPLQATSDAWCAHVTSGPGGSRDVPVDLSTAHVTTRVFGVDSIYGVSDAALTQALQVQDLPDVLDRYAAALSDVCALPADGRPLAAARVQKLGWLAVVTPGTGEVQLPPGTKGVVLDLRNLPSADGLDAALAHAVAPALHTPVRREGRWVRAHDGPWDEAFSSTNAYRTFVTLQQPPPIAATGEQDLPLIVLTGERMAPAAAAFAGALRLAGRAWIVGADLLTEVAESEWHGVGTQGLAVRTACFDRLLTTVASQPLSHPIVTQDDPNDPGTASYRWDVEVPQGTRLLDVTARGDLSGGVDLDLYVLYDTDKDGAFRFPEELVAFSQGPTADEHAQVMEAPVEPGRYQVWVHGWRVPERSAPFELGVELVGGLWPDRIPADAPAAGTPGSLVSLAGTLFSGSPAPVEGVAERSFHRPGYPFGVRQPAVTGKPEMRAALIVAHGMLRTFFPYFDVVGDTIDVRLLETLQGVEDWDGTDRGGAEKLLGRFGEAIHDGHQFVFNYGPATFSGYLPVHLEEVSGRPVVRRSATSLLRPGDTILAMDGRAIEEIYAEIYARTSAATHGYLFDRASREVARLSAPVTLDVADPDGVLRQVTVAPQSLSAYNEARAAVVSSRPSGPLDDLGAPQLQYVNMNTAASPSTVYVRSAIANAVALGASGLILDMRGYPGGANHYEIAQYLIRQPFTSAQFWVPQKSLAVAYELTQYSIYPLPSPAWNGPVVLLTGPHAVSAAENFMQMLVGAGRLAGIVGEQRSAGTNGNITGVQLPGGFGFSYTGMRVLNPDGSRHHGVGIVPTVQTTLTAADLRDGVDRDLVAAIELLSGR